MIADRDIGWLAGIIDGEGTIGITRTNDKRFENAYYRPHLQIANTDLRILDRCRDMLSALTSKRYTYVVTTNSKHKDRGWKKGYRLAVHSQREMLVILPVLIPHLTAKREQAEAALEFAQRRIGRISKRWHEFKSEDDAAYARCIALNRRGWVEDEAPVAEVIPMFRSA